VPARRSGSVTTRAGRPRTADAGPVSKKAHSYSEKEGAVAGSTLLGNSQHLHQPIPKHGTPTKERQYEATVPTLTDRVAQMALKLVLEPIFEVDFYPSSYGYRPGRRAQDAIAEIHQLASRSYEWVIEGDIKACFDNVDHRILMGLVAERVGDRKVLRLVCSFLRAGVIEQQGGFAASLTGTPQGGVASPLLANIYLSVLDRHFAAIWDKDMSPPWRRQHRRRKGLPNYRLVRYADDFVVLVPRQPTLAPKSTTRPARSRILV